MTETEHRVQPLQILIHPVGALVDTLGRFELESVAALIVRWHVVRQHAEWTPVSRKEIAEMMLGDDTVKAWAKNPFWVCSPYDFISDGYIDGWGTGSTDCEGKGTLTQKFHDALSVRANKDRDRSQRVLIDPRESP